ncbi:hypothetical protein EV146_11826 [Mesobacillus foraminis]|uniref:Transposase IS116/IS110/IS902 family protein n=1 Tax=Mesobacillus foraminis TaxID=279826 RepID=A0A4R2B149_9BACI|nr:hypothetical protein EV146_11826 [Mesobacillus foraminis]
MILVAKDKAFKALHHYYTTRSDNPLKKMQSLIALCNKLIRILFSIGKKKFVFQEEKMLKDTPPYSCIYSRTNSSLFTIKLTFNK